MITVYFKDGSKKVLHRSYLSVVYADRRVVRVVDNTTGKTVIDR